MREDVKRREGTTWVDVGRREKGGRRWEDGGYNSKKEGERREVDGWR